MATQILTRRGTGDPANTTLAHGELAVDTASGKLYVGDAATNTVELVGPNAPGQLWNAGTDPNDITNANSGNVGIGTAAPSANLHVREAATVGTNHEMLRLQTAVGGNMRFYVDDLSQSNPVWRIQSNAGEALSFGVGSYPAGEAMRIDVFGNVGIGTTAPSSALTINRNGANGVIEVTRDDGASSVASLAAVGSLARLTSQIGDLQIRAIDGVGNVTFHSGGTTEHMRIASDGKVGIGNTSPQLKLSVNGGTQAGVIRVEGTHATGALIDFHGLSSTVTSPPRIGGNGDDMIFITQLTERMRIDSNGNVLVGGTSIIGPLARMALHQRTGQYALSFRSADVSGTQYFYLGQTSGDAAELVNQNGVGVRLQNGATSWTAGSDERIKNIHGNIDNAVAAIEGWRCVKYTLKEGGDKQMLGLIAQDVEPHYPEIVSHDEKGMMGLRYTELVPVLVKAIQELHAEIEALKNP